MTSTAFASNHAEKKQARRATDLRAERVKLKAVLYDAEKLSDKQKVAAMKELITNEPHSRRGQSRGARAPITC
jgi:hypothetical protein